MMPNVRNWEEEVAPTTGAWIETLHGLIHRIIVIVAPTTGAWIETKLAFHEKRNINRRSHHGSVD